jgi:hypothetical protein
MLTDALDPRIDASACGFPLGENNDLLRQVVSTH